MQTQDNNSQDNNSQNNQGKENSGEADESTISESDAPESDTEDSSSQQDVSSEDESAENESADTPEDEMLQLKDKLQRTLAELENTRRRFDREKQDMAKYAIAGFATDILNMADNLERAINSVSDDAKTQNAALANFVKGVALSAHELSAIFERNQITKINPEKGEAFSYNQHQAVSEIVTEDQPTGTVVEILQPGYILHDRLIRPAMVVVAKAK